MRPESRRGYRLPLLGPHAGKVTIERIYRAIQVGIRDLEL